MPVIAVPEPSLVVLVGAAGSGKSTFAGRWFSSDEVLSSDRLRGILTGDESDQRASRTAFSIIHREVGRRLTAGRLVVVDATSAKRTSRRPLTVLAARARVPSIAIVFALPAAVVLERNAARTERVVAPEIVEGHLALVARLDAPTLLAEGFAAAHILRSDGDVAAAVVAR